MEDKDLIEMIVKFDILNLDIIHEQIVSSADEIGSPKTRQQIMASIRSLRKKAQALISWMNAEVSRIMAHSRDEGKKYITSKAAREVKTNARKSYAAISNQISQLKNMLKNSK